MENSMLTHHGILGQKWGVRRYQNKDGTLTPAGQKRYGVETVKKVGAALTSKSPILTDGYRKGPARQEELMKRNGINPNLERKDPSGAIKNLISTQDRTHSAKIYGNGNSDGAASEKKEVDPEKRERMKKVAIGVGAAVTVAAATALYLNNKEAIDDFVSSHKDQLVSTLEDLRIDMKQNRVDRIARNTSKTMEYVNANKHSIMRSPSKLSKYQGYLSDKEIKSAIDKLKTEREINQLTQDNIRKGANFAQAFLAYGTAASTAYGLTKSQMVKDSLPKKDVSEMSNKELQDKVNRRRLEQQYQELYGRKA